MEFDYRMRLQREIYLLTIRNDIILKSYPLRLRKKYFDQLGVGSKVFKKKWDNIFFRFVFSCALPLIMLMSDLFFPLIYSFKLLMHGRKQNDIKRMFISHDRRLYYLSKQCNLQNESDVWFRLFDDNYELPEKKSTVSLIDFVTMKEIFLCAIQAFLIHIKIVYTLGYDKYFLSFKAYQWCLTDCALRHIPYDVELIYSAICDRLAIMIDHLPVKNRVMIQHGTMHFPENESNSPYMTWNEDFGFFIWNSLYRSSPSLVYCFTQDDEYALSHSVIANSPKYIHMGYNFKPAFRPNKKSVLIIGNSSLYGDKEEIIIRNLQGLDIEIFLKNHPTKPDNYYDEMRSKYKFNYIRGVDTSLPAVDILISYNSTMAFEYASIGTKVFYYSQINVNEIKRIVIEFLDLN